MKKISYLILGAIFFVSCNSDPEKKEAVVHKDSATATALQPNLFDTTSIYEQVTGPDLFPIGSEVYLYEDSVDIVKGPSHANTVISTFRIGTPLKILSKSKSRFTNHKGINLPWYKVEFQSNGLKQTGFVWAGFLSIASATLNSPSGKNQVLLTGMDNYEEPGLYGGGFTLKAKLIENFRTLSTVIFADDIQLTMMETVDANELKVEKINTNKLKNLTNIIGIYNASAPKFKNQLPSRSYLFITNENLNHLGNADSLFVPEHPKGKETKLIVEHYNWESPQKISIHHEYTWNGIGIVSQNRQIFRDPVKLYAKPDLASLVSCVLHPGDSVITYRPAGDVNVNKGLKINGVSLPWVHASANNGNKFITGYVWYGDLVFSSANFILPENKLLRVHTGIKSVNAKNDNNFEVDIKLQIDTVKFPLMAFTFVTCGEPEGGPYIFPDITLIDKKFSGVQTILRLYYQNSCEGSDPTTEIYLLYDGKKWHSIKAPLQNYDLKYEVIFPEDKNGKEGKILLYKITGWPDKEIRTLYKKYNWDGKNLK